MVERCLATNGLGYEVFNVSNDNHSVAMTTPQIIDEFYKDVPMAAEMGEYETFYSNAKAKRMLGFAPQHNWQP